jgi:anti-sigma-K factor RskA
LSDTPLTCEETETLLPEYALGALDADEAAAVVRHLGDCREHAASLDAYQAVGDGLSASVPLVDPPARLKARVLSSVAAPRRAARRAWPGWVVAAAAAAVALVLGFQAASLQRQLDELDARRRQVEAIADRPDAHMIPLAAETGVTAKGVLIYADYEAVVWAVALPATQGEEVYQCWWITGDNQRISGGTFRAREGGSVWIVSIPENVERFRRIAITREPDDGGTEPRGPLVLAGEF